MPFTAYTVASLCTAPSRTTRAHSKATARSGISPVLAAVSQVICPCDLGKPSRSPSRCRMNNGSKCLKRWSGGRERAGVCRGEHDD
jgi:hypothetical protein